MAVRSLSSGMRLRYLVTTVYSENPPCDFVSSVLLVQAITSNFKLRIRVCVLVVEFS